VVAAEAAFADGDEWLDAVIRQLDFNRSLLIDQLPSGIQWTPPEATYVAWLDCGGLGLGEDPSEVFLREAKVALGPGRDYDPSNSGFVRLNFGTSDELLTEMLRRMNVVVG
jgi:cystathionine beta-lyase